MWLTGGQICPDSHNLWRIILGSVFTMMHLLLLPACSWHLYHSTALVECKMIIPWLPVPLKPIGSHNCMKTRMMPGSVACRGSCWVGYWLNESERREAVCKAKIFVHSSNTPCLPFSSSLLSPFSFLILPPLFLLPLVLFSLLSCYHCTHYSVI